MNPQVIATGARMGAKIWRLASSGEERDNFALKIEHLLLIAAGLLLVALVSCFLIFSFVVGGLGGSGNSGFRSGPPTAFAVADIPAQHLPVFLRAQDRYGVSWAVLAAIWKVESRPEPGTPEAGAAGFMRLRPSVFDQYRQDGDNDGICDLNNPWDAVFTTANMLRANGYAGDPRNAVFSYNHADWYVNRVMDVASQYSSTILPAGNGIWPLPSRYVQVLSGYGTRMHPFLNQYHFHDGIDIPAPEGTPVFAVQDGRVDWDRQKGGYGLCVVLDHSGCRTLYAHLSGIAVRSGEEVEAGQTIGYVGSTGLSTGPHLHFSVYVNGQPCNPEEWLAAPSGNG